MCTRGAVASQFETEMDKYKFLRIILIVKLILLNVALFSQYLRDSTRFIGLDDLYPKEDSLIFDLYRDEEKHPLEIHEIYFIPEVAVSFEGADFPFFFDFGNSGNITITNSIADSLKYIITDTTFTYTPDGKIRGKVYDILLPEFHTLDQSFLNETGTLSDWSIFSNHPINGLIGLKYLDAKCFTLSYPRKLLAISEHSIVPEVTGNSHSVIRLEKYKMHPYGIHFIGSVNGQVAIIYFDTGKSHSAINQALVPSDKIVSDKSGAFYNGTVEIDMAGRIFKIYYPRVKDTRRNVESDLPVGIEMGSDLLKYFLLTIDRTNNQNLLIIH